MLNNNLFLVQTIPSKFQKLRNDFLQITHKKHFVLTNDYVYRHE
jgi:hypothetical protein